MTLTISALPDDLLLELCNSLPLLDQARLARTSRQFAWVLSPRLYHWAIFKISCPAKTRSLQSGKVNTCAKKWKSEFAIAYFRERSDILLAHRDWRGRSLLHHFAKLDNTCLLGCLLSFCGDISPIDLGGDTPLHVALSTGAENTTVQLLEAGADVLTPTSPRSILTWMQSKISTDVGQKVITAIKNADGDISTAGSDGQTPLHHASIRRNDRLVGLLIKNGADVLRTNKYGHVPLISTVVHGVVEVGKLLLDEMMLCGLDINAPIPDLNPAPAPWAPDSLSRFYNEGDSLLHLAVMTWNTKIVKLLLSYGSSPLVKNIRGETAFDTAVAGRAPDMVQTIVTCTRPSPAFWHSEGRVQEGFETCVREAYAGTVRVLVDLARAGKVELKINNLSNEGYLPMLSTCTYYGSHVLDRDINDTITSVVSAGANLNARGPGGKTALHLLCDDNGVDHGESQIALIKFFLDAGADWRLKDNEGNTALHAAAGRLFNPVLEHIFTIATSAQDREILTQGNDRGETALHWAATSTAGETSFELLSTINLLVNAQLNRDAVNNKGQSIAHLFVRGRHYEDALEILPMVAPNMHLKDREGNPPVHYVARNGRGAVRWLEMCRYLEAIGAASHEGCDQCESFMARYHGKYAKTTP